MIIKKDSEIVKTKVERKSHALKAKKKSSDEECSNFGSEDEEYTMAIRDFKKCGNPNHPIGECPKPPKDKNQRAFVRGSWSDSGEEDDEKVKNETCLVARASSEIRGFLTNETPMSFDTKLTKDEECKSVDSTKYRGMIASLLYLTTSRPDIMFSVCLYACFQEAPKTYHLEAVKCIFRYIKGTTHLGLWYPKGTNIEIVVYADSDHARDYVNRISTSGIYTFVGCCLTSWLSKKQTTLAISTIEAEYVIAKEACAIDLSKNPMQHPRTKHIKILHHFLRDNVQKGHISIEKVSSVDNIAEILTKPLKRESFNYLRLGLGMMEHIP
nr:copia protein [Tanacetum cinerariifolium]